jgi:hypothetical protein
MISASEARELSRPVIEAELDLCDKAVRAILAREDGSNKTYVHKPLHEQTIERLKELGYGVTVYSDHHDGITTTISW